MSPEEQFTLGDVARTVVAHHAVNGTYWADGPGRTHWMVLWKVPEAREPAAANADAWERFEELTAEVRTPGRLPDLDRGWLDTEAGRLEPAVRWLAREHATSERGHLSGWALRHSASVLGSAHRRMDRRQATGRRGRSTGSEGEP